MSRVQYLIGDVRARLADLPDGSVDLVVTSWPYWLQRAYLPEDHPNKPDEIGQEPTVAEFIDTLLAITGEVGRVLAPHGSIAMELADTYSGSGGAGGDYQAGGLRDGQPVWRGSGHVSKSRHSIDNHGRGDRRLTVGNATRQEREAAGIVPVRDRKKHDGQVGVIPPDKSLCMIPELFRIALAYGINPLTGAESPAGMWRCRNVVLHCRPNPSVGADGDKFRPGKSDWVIATRARRRYWDGFAVRVPASQNTNPRTAKGQGKRAENITPKGRADEDNRHTMAMLESTGDTSPLLDHWWADDPRLDRFEQEAWHLSTAPYKGAHFATFSPKLITPMILAMCPERVCTVCGEPARRITSSDSTKTRNSNGTKNAEKNHKGHNYDARTDVAVEHVGWEECDCAGGDGRWRRGVVLDPFGGSGTTGMVASSNGRDAILIDFDDRNIDLARERCGMFLEVDS